MEAAITIRVFDPVFSICKVKDFESVDLYSPFVFIGRTDEENSLVCPLDMVPYNTIEREDGWRMFRMEGDLALSMVGILSRISGILADADINIFAVSTYNTDYILVPEIMLQDALDVLAENGYIIEVDES